MMKHDGLVFQVNGLLSSDVAPDWRVVPSLYRCCQASKLDPWGLDLVVKSRSCREVGFHWPPLSLTDVMKRLGKSLQAFDFSKRHPRGRWSRTLIGKRLRHL